MLKVIAHQVTDSIDIRAFRTAFPEGLQYVDKVDELFYKSGNEKLMYVFKYGVICFLNYSEEEISGFLKQAEPFCKKFLGTRLREEFLVETDAKENKFGFNKIEITHADTDVFRIIMLNVSQSVALDYYLQQTETILEETTNHTITLEQKGKLDISGKYLRRYIGKTLNLKNRIEKNLYIFDAPKATWDNELLNKINTELKYTFDLQLRYKNVSQQLETIKENLDLFKDIMQYSKSNLLEWIVIALVLIQILNLIFDKLNGG